ncbi:sigma-70 family RNA polymerase sigma factor [Bacillus sp. S/N-304-OC-R1]|uniref:sigma-70 family RNA polymerase sigma factor n=1 Tax=Bacillus sp. S/N-304-OC-R1 TaxID=2758034 RepID=UPI001C8EDE05|nr:sigma-70 family RNA polymerase sigma factor [Bacillus sp. S/N-304-OC-R1]MBY0122111.1 sigma-70 family RNA polymerase sigma factor [Bacillus sp. S/N-304-OC-R1]
MSLIKKAKKGDDGAFYELMQIHKIQLLKIAFSYLRNEDDAMEALQEVTFRAYRSIHKVKEAQYFSTWLIRIMLNYCHDQAQKKKRIAENSLLDNLAETTDPNQTLEIQEALEKIDSRCREVIILKYYHDLRIKDIAEILESPESTIKTWLYKGLKALRSQMEDRSGYNV